MFQHCSTKRKLDQSCVVHGRSISSQQISGEVLMHFQMRRERGTSSIKARRKKDCVKQDLCIMTMELMKTKVAPRIYCFLFCFKLWQKSRYRMICHSFLRSAHYIAGQPYYIRCWEQQMSRKAIKLCKIQLPFSNENVT